MQLVTTFSSLPSPAITMSTPHTSHLAQTRNRHRVNRLHLLANRRLRRRLLFRARVARALTLVHVVNAALLNATHRTTRLHRVKRPESDAAVSARSQHVRRRIYSSPSPRIATSRLRRNVGRKQEGRDSVLVHLALLAHQSRAQYVIHSLRATDIPLLHAREPRSELPPRTPDTPRIPSPTTSSLLSSRSTAARGCRPRSSTRWDRSRCYNRARLHRPLLTQRHVRNARAVRLLPEIHHQRIAHVVDGHVSARRSRNQHVRVHVCMKPAPQSAPYTSDEMAPSDELRRSVCTGARTRKS